MKFDPDALAVELHRAAKTAVPVDLLTQRFPGLTFQDARAVALATDRLRLAEADQQLGYKLGWTSSAMRDSLGIDRPNWGTLWRSQVLVGDLDLTELIHPKIEPELVYRSGTELSGEVSQQRVNETGQWLLGLEVVDPRFPSFDFDWLDNTADNSSCGRVVLGAAAVRTHDPASVRVSFTDGLDVRRGVGADAMGSPAASVAWLVQSLTSEGSGLLAGHIVFTGGLAPPFDVTGGSTYVLSAPGFDSVSLAIS